MLWALPVGEAVKPHDTSSGERVNARKTKLTKRDIEDRGSLRATPRMARASYAPSTHFARQVIPRAKSIPCLPLCAAHM
jgi:hypothetical protein